MSDTLATKKRTKASSTFESVCRLHDQFVDEQGDDDGEGQSWSYDSAADFYEFLMGEADGPQEFIRRTGHHMLDAEDVNDPCFDGIPKEQRESCLKAVEDLGRKLAAYQAAKDGIEEAVEDLRYVWTQMYYSHPEWSTPGKSCPPHPRKKEKKGIGISPSPPGKIVDRPLLHPYDLHYMAAHPDEFDEDGNYVPKSHDQSD